MKDQSIFIFVSQSLFLGMKDLNIEYFGGDGITKYQCSVCINLGWQTLVLHCSELMHSKDLRIRVLQQRKKIWQKTNYGHESLCAVCTL